MNYSTNLLLTPTTCTVHVILLQTPHTNITTATTIIIRPVRVVPLRCVAAKLRVAATRPQYTALKHIIADFHDGNTTAVAAGATTSKDASSSSNTKNMDMTMDDLLDDAEEQILLAARTMQV